MEVDLDIMYGDLVQEIGFVMEYLYFFDFFYCLFIKVRKYDCRIKLLS